MGKGGQNSTYEKNGGAKGVRATARLLGGTGGMLPQKIFDLWDRFWRIFRHICGFQKTEFSLAIL